MARVMSQRFTIVRFLLGSLLLVAAGLKLYGLSVSAIPRVGWFSQPWVQLAAAQWELALGLWLLSGAYPRLSWLAAVITFATFAAISSRLGSLGVASCGCFGSIQASPWSAFLVDVVALLLLVRVRPPMAASGREVAPAVTKGMKWAGGVAVLLAVLALVGTWMSGSPSSALARLRGEAISVDDPYLDFGSGHAGDDLEGSITVRNWTDQPIQLVGGTSDCSCTTINDLPATIEPNGAIKVRVQMHVPSSQAGQLTRMARLLTDLPQQSVVSFRIGCRIE
jgi:hypothetical protein